jgi:DNA excision repair protein ERCC-4
MHRSDEPVAIVADDRERPSGVIEALETISQVSVQVGRLPIGDYLAEKRILFERKTLPDFACSLVDGRLLKQMLRLANAHHKAVLILEGTAHDLNAVGVRREALQGALITISLILGIPVLRSMQPAETAGLIVYAARQISTLEKGGFQRPGYRPKSKKGRQVFILQGLPGIGRERALRLLDAFGSVAAVMQASPDQLKTVAGIGEKTAQRVQWAVSEALAAYGNDCALPI